jgi:tryptophan halogenase
MKKIDSIIVVGGGTAGCISALILKTRFPQIEIKIIESSDVGIVGVGESSTEHWAQFCSFIGINQLDAILHCNGTFKIGVYFEDWSEKDFMHTISFPFSKTYGAYYGIYAHQISKKCSPKEICTPNSWKNEVTTDFFNHLNDSPTNQYHFDTFALNQFLHKECEKRNIEIIIDNLTGVSLDEETGDIRSVVSNEWEHFADFFIDCSGFSRLLLHKTYKIKWKSYAQYFPLNSAIAFQTDEMQEYNKYTKSTARKCGWSWKIPTQTRTGNGYVYCDAFIGKDEAHQEMETAYGKKLEITRSFNFDPGRLEKAWHKNCYAVGLSQSFVEPLEATSIGSVIQQMFCFMHFLPSYDEKSCNRHVNEIFDNIVDYVQAHYLVKRENTPFWREVKYNLTLTPSLNDRLDMWKNRLPLLTDISTQWGMFNSVNYIPILYGLDWFDVTKIQQEYMNIEQIIKDNVIYELEQMSNTSFSISHKKFITEIMMNR